MYNGLASKVYDVLASYAQQQGYTLVLDVCPAAESRALCQPIHQTSPRPIIDAYNVKSGVPAPPAPPASGGSRRQAGRQASRRTLKTGKSDQTKARKGPAMRGLCRYSASLLKSGGNGSSPTYTLH